MNRPNKVRALCCALSLSLLSSAAFSQAMPGSVVDSNGITKQVQPVYPIGPGGASPPGSSPSNPAYTTSTSSAPPASGVPSNEVNGNISSLSTTTETTLIAAQGSGKRVVLDYVAIYNPDSNDHVYALRTVAAGSIRVWATISAGTASPVFLPPSGLNALAANTAVTVQIVDANAITTGSQVAGHGFTTTQ